VRLSNLRSVQMLEIPFITGVKNGRRRRNRKVKM
jgi:hypothetical protein